MRLLQEQRRGLERCVELMELHNNDGSVQQSLLGAATIFADNKEVRTTSAEAVPLVIKSMRHFEGLVRLQINAMRSHPLDAKLQEHAIGALKNLCDTIGRATLCARQGGVEAIVGALKKYQMVDGVVVQGCMVLCMFCDDFLIRQKIVLAGTRAVAKKISRNAYGEAQQWGVELLRELTKDEER